MQNKKAILQRSIESSDLCFFFTHVCIQLHCNCSADIFKSTFWEMMCLIFSSACNWNKWRWNDDLQFCYHHSSPHSSTKHFVCLTIPHFVWPNLHALLNVSFFKDRQFDWLLLNMQTNTITPYSGGGVHVVCFKLYMFATWKENLYCNHYWAVFFSLIHSVTETSFILCFHFPFLAVVQ